MGMPICVRLPFSQVFHDGIQIQETSPITEDSELAAYQVTAEHKMDLCLRLGFQYCLVFCRSTNIYEGLGT